VVHREWLPVGAFCNACGRCSAKGYYIRETSTRPDGAHELISSMGGGGGTYWVHTGGLEGPAGSGSPDTPENNARVHQFPACQKEQDRQRIKNALGICDSGGQGQRRYGYIQLRMTTQLPPTQSPTFNGLTTTNLA